MLNLANFIGVSVYLWSVDEKNHFLQTNLQKTPSTRSTANEPGRLGDQSRRIGWIRSRITNDVIERLWSN
jgi:hypothetical protein